MQPGVRLLGTPSIRKGGEWHEVPLDKRLALLTYLACSSAWVSREHLSFLFWPDTSSANARINLRQLLARTKSLPLTVDIEAEDKRLRWTVDSDVAEFRNAVNDADWATASRTYRGDLVADLVVADASEFMSWLEFERDQLRESHRHAVLHEAEIAVAAGQPARTSCAASSPTSSIGCQPSGRRSACRWSPLRMSGREGRTPLSSFGACSSDTRRHPQVSGRGWLRRWHQAGPKTRKAACPLQLTVVRARSSPWPPRSERSWRGRRRGR